MIDEGRSSYADDDEEVGSGIWRSRALRRKLCDSKFDEFSSLLIDVEFSVALR